jgi:hypothetical protein
MRLKEMAQTYTRLSHIAKAVGQEVLAEPMEMATAR